MYAAIGDLIFEPLTGFTSFSDNEDAVVAQYPLIKGKPYPQPMAPKLKETSIGMRFHQRFIRVKEAKLQLIAYLQNGTVVTLSFGNGEIAGRYIITNINTGIEESDGLGNVYCLGVNVQLLEVPAEQLLDAKQGDAYKAAFGVGDFTTEVVYPPVRQPTALEVFLGQLQRAMRYAALIDALAYGGRFPVYLGSSLGQILGNAKANSVLMGQQFGAHGSGWDIPDIAGDIVNVTNSLTVLEGIDPVADAAGFADANKIYQGFNRTLCF